MAELAHHVLLTNCNLPSAALECPLCVLCIVWIYMCMAMYVGANNYILCMYIRNSHSVCALKLLSNCFETILKPV